MSTATHQISIRAVLLWVTTGSANRISLGVKSKWDVTGSRFPAICIREVRRKASSSVNLN